MTTPPSSTPVFGAAWPKKAVLAGISPVRVSESVGAAIDRAEPLGTEVDLAGECPAGRLSRCGTRLAG